MKNRKLHHILKRITNLPTGAGTFKYLFNRISLLISRKSRTLNLPHPNVIMLEVTNHCQLHCITCAREYAFGHSMDIGHMDFSEAKKIIDENHIYLDSIGLTGLGEPLLYPHLKQLIEYIREKNKGMLIFISTNAQHKKTVEILSSIADKIDTLQISIDGIGDTFERIRKNGDYVSFIKNCREIVKFSRSYRFYIKLNMVVFEENYREMKDVIQFAKEYGINEVSFNSLNQVAIDKDMSDYSFYHSASFKKELQEASALAKQLDIHSEYPNIGKRNTFYTCPYPWTSFYITWDGYLAPCCAKPFWKEMNFGNVFFRGLMSCINDKKLVNFRKMSNKNIVPEFCKDCHHVN